MRGYAASATAGAGRRGVRWTAVTATLLLGLAGCGGEPSASNGAGGAAGSSSTGGAGGVGGGGETFCEPGVTESCYSGPAGTAGVGNCRAGERACSSDGAGFGACSDEILPVQESCATPADDNCDGEINEGCACTPGATEACYSGPAGTLGVGACAAGTHTCAADGQSFGPCAGEALPGAEACETVEDDDCDGEINEGCLCSPGETEACYSGPSGTLGVGACSAGTHTCAADGKSWSACAGQALPVNEACGTLLDDDCDGQINEACLCAPGETAACYSGPAGTLGVGACAAGTHTCAADGKSWSACAGQALPGSESCGSPADENCDGQSNESCVCAPGETAACYAGPAGTLGIGACEAGLRACAADGKSWGACAGQTLPLNEACGTLIDDNCDGSVNEGCLCAPGATEPCYSGPAGTLGIGVCAAGSHTCAADGKSWGACSGQVLPGIETCSTLLDEDCDAQVNESCVCAPGASEACYSGPPGSLGVGQCAAGSHTCAADGLSYGPCSGQVLPAIESCASVADDDCDGQINESCLCAPGATEACAYAGPPGTAGVGACKAGTKTCALDGMSYSACSGEVLPLLETCSSAADDDCDGQVNEVCVCSPGATVACAYSGPPGTLGVGACKAGTKTCAADGQSFSACSGETLPAAESCSSAADDDCDGQANDGCICAPGAVAACPYSGPPGTLGVGLCQAGTKTCAADGQSFSACSGEVVPQAEVCGSPDDESCDGSPGCTGAHIWSKRFGNANYQSITRVVIDGAGNILLAGVFQDTITFGGATLTSSALSQDAFVAKLDSAGNHLWSKRYGGTSTDAALGLAVDPAGNVLVAGYFGGSVDFGGGALTAANYLEDMFFVKLDPNGNHIWSQRAGSNETDMAVDAASDSSGNWIITGRAAGPFNLAGLSYNMISNAAFVLKLSPNGNGQWFATCGGYDYPGSYSDLEVAVDAGGNALLTRTVDQGAYCVGGPYISAGGGGDVIVAKVNPAGAHVWSKPFGDPSFQSSSGVAVDADGNMLITGYFYGTVNFGLGPLTPTGTYDVFVAKFGPASDLLWAKNFGAASATSFGNDVAADSDGNVLLAGSTTGAINFGLGPLAHAGGYDAFAAKLDPNGVTSWAKLVGNAQDQFSWAITADASSNVLLGGSFKGTVNLGGNTLTATPGGGMSEYDIFLAKMSP